MKDHVLTQEERNGLTMWGEFISAQCRDEGQIALHIRENVPRDVQGTAVLPAGDVAKLRALIDESECT